MIVINRPWEVHIFKRCPWTKGTSMSKFFQTAYYVQAWMISIQKWIGHNLDYFFSYRRRSLVTAEFESWLCHLLDIGLNKLFKFIDFSFFPLKKWDKTIVFWDGLNEIMAVKYLASKPVQSTYSMCGSYHYYYELPFWRHVNKTYEVVYNALWKWMLCKVKG